MNRLKNFRRLSSNFPKYSNVALKNAITISVRVFTVFNGTRQQWFLIHQKFIQKNKLAVDLLSDPKHEVLKSYGAWGKKKMYGKEYDGVIRSTVVIDPQGKVRHSWPKAKAKGHAAEVLQALRKVAN